MDSDIAAISRELRAIVREAERITGLRSRWNGRVHVESELDALGRQPFKAKKEWECGIAVHVSLEAADRFSSLAHEAFHSVSVGVTPQALWQFRGYEEGVVEWLTRSIGPHIARKLGVSAPFRVRDAFEDMVVHLEALRSATSLDAEPFYLRLLSTPLVERQNSVVQWAIAANPAEEPARVLAHLAPAMRGLR